MSIITITDSAKNRFRDLVKNESFEAIAFGVSSGGCSGFSYSLSDIKLSEIYPNDEVVTFDDVSIVVDNMSIMYVAGTEIDWVSDLMGSRFEFSNPIAANKCGCNKSFGV